MIVETHIPDDLASNVMAYAAQSTPEPTREEVDRRPGPLVIEFGADWCPHCQAVQGLLKEHLDKHPEIEHLKIEDGRGKPLGRSFRVKLWPTLVFLRNGQVQAQITRPSETELHEAFERALGGSR